MLKGLTQKTNCFCVCDIVKRLLIWKWIPWAYRLNSRRIMSGHKTSINWYCISSVNWSYSKNQILRCKYIWEGENEIVHLRFLMCLYKEPCLQVRPMPSFWSESSPNILWVTLPTQKSLLNSKVTEEVGGGRLWITKHHETLLYMYIYI